MPALDGGSVPPASLADLRAHLGACERCELCQGRHNIVFGSGNPHARVMFIGEAPGKNEDESGEPFVGAAGKQLASFLDKAGLVREDIYIANVLKCRPPSNRNPRVSEIDACAPYLREQVRLVWPEVIVTLGNFATQFIMRTGAGVTTLRGQFYQVGAFVVMPSLHPAATLYHRDWQPLIEADFEMLGRYLASHPEPQRA